MANVFISYSSEQQVFATSLRDALAGRGHEPWMDDREIPGGARFMEAIVPAIERADAVLVVLTNSWLASPVCRQKLDTASSFNKRIVPVEPKRERLRSRPPALDGLSPIGFWYQSA